MAGKTYRPAVSMLLAYAFVIVLGGIGVYRSYGTPEGISWWASTCVMFGSVSLALGLFMRMLPATTPAEAAEQMLEQQKALYSGLHEFRAATAGDFRGLDKEFYEQATAVLKRSRYRHLGDVVNVTASNTWPRAQAVLRCFASADGMVGVAAYHVRFFGFVRLLQIAGVLPRRMKMYDVTTELTDGLQIMTSNSREADKTGAVPGIDREQHPMDTPLEELVDLHADHVRRLRADRPEASPVIFRTLTDALESENRQQILKNQHRQRVGFLPPDELRRITGAGNSDAERQIIEELEMELEERQQKPHEDEEIPITNDENLSR